MTILNRPSDGLYNVLIVLVRNIIRFAPRDQEQLLLACGSGLDSVDPSHLGRTLTRWTALGLFESTKDSVAIAEPWRSALGAQPDAAEARLPRIARQIVLSAENNARFWDAEGARSADFSRGVAWMLAQDVYTLPQTTKELEALLRSQLIDPDGTTIVQNDTRWNGLRDWMPYLGFARDDGRWDVDPTEALRDALPDIFGAAPTLLAGEFLERAAAQLPVLDGGTYRREVEGVLKEASWSRPPEGSVSTSLSRALLRLERSGSVRLEQRSDTREGAVLMGRNRRRWRDFSHITIAKKKVR